MHVVGDTIIDSYTHCALIGGMTKTPTMSVRYDKRLDFVGGAGIVAKHLCSAGADVSFSTVLGNDALAEFALKDLAAAGVKCMPIIDRTRPTTHKNAIIAGGYNLLKIDTLDNRSISERILRTAGAARSANRRTTSWCSAISATAFSTATPSRP